MLKHRQIYNGKSVVPIYPTFKFSTMLTIPIRLARKYDLKESYIDIEERGEGVLFIKKATDKTRVKTFSTGTAGKHSSCGITIPAYLAHKHGYAGGGCYVVLTEEDDGILMKKLII